MVEDRIADGKRIAQLLSSELDGREDGELASVAVTNSNRDVEPTVDGARAYDVVLRSETGNDSDDGDDGDNGDDGDTVDDSDESDTDTDTDAHDRLAKVFVHPERAHLEFTAEQSTAADAADDRDLRVRPKATQPPRTLVFVESGAEVKRATDVVQAAIRAVSRAEETE